MSEPPMIDLGRFGSSIPDPLPEWMAERGVTRAEREKRGAVLSTRDMARKVIADRPDAFASHMVYLNALKVEIATPSFFDELLRSCPRAQLVGASPSVQASWDVVAKRAG